MEPVLPQSLSPALLLVRPAPDSQRLLRAVELRLGRTVRHVVSPVLQIVPVPAEAPVGEPILTSAHGARRAAEMGMSGRAWCVGPRTAGVAKSLGFHAVSAGGAAEDLISLVQANARGPLVHIRGRHTTGEIAARLGCAEVIAYDQQALSINQAAQELVRGELPVALPLFSDRSLRLCLNEGLGRASVRPVCISENVAYQWPGPTTVADAPNLPSMIDAIVEVLNSGG